MTTPEDLRKYGTALTLQFDGATLKDTWGSGQGCARMRLSIGCSGSYDEELYASSKKNKCRTINQTRPARTHIEISNKTK